MTGTVPAVVMGQGSLGTLFATLLAQAGHETVVVSSRAGASETVELEVTGRVTARASVRLQPKLPEEGEAWVAVVATRASEALEAARRADRSVAKEGVLLAVQNGLTPLSIREALGSDRVVPGVVGFNAKLRTPRRVEVTSPGGVSMGVDGEAAPGFERLVRSLRGPLAVDVTRNPVGAVWSKWCISCAINGLAVVTGEGVGALTRERLGREALVALITETTRLAKAEGVELERVAGPLAPDSLAGSNRGLGGRFRRGVAWLIGRGYGGVVPSSLDAALEGRDPELEALNGRAVELGEAHGVATPWNRAVEAVAGSVLEGEHEASMGNLAVLKASVA